jgi:hypothetical protein
VAQISEFSIVFVAMGITLGHVGVPVLGLVTLVGVVTITLSTYMILYAQPLYERLSPWLGVFERRRPARELAVERQAPPEGSVQVLLFGLGRYGSRLLKQLRKAGVNALGVDFDPEAVRVLRRQGLPVRFGDGEDPEFVASLPLAEARWVISTRCCTPWRPRPTAARCWRWHATPNRRARWPRPVCAASPAPSTMRPTTRRQNWPRRSCRQTADDKR